MNGGELIGRVLEQHGVKFLYTLVGGHISPILVGAKKAGLRVVDVRDEATAVFAADATARLTGIPGVAAVTAGPGLTNTVTAVQNALMAESPLVVLGGATATILKGRGSLQDIDQMSLMKPITKWAATAKSVRGLIAALEKGLRIAVEGVPGPVFIECPVDLLYDEATVREWYEKEGGGGGKDIMSRALGLYLKQHLWRQFSGSDSIVPSAPSPVEPPLARSRDLDRVADAISDAERPVLVVGSQAMLMGGEADRVADAVRALGIPTFLGGMARGLLGQSNDIQFRHKRSAALKKADLVIVAGFPLDFRMGYGMKINRSATLVTVNRDSNQLSNAPVWPTIGIQADPGRFLQSIATRVPPAGGRWSAWFEQLRENEAAREAAILEESQQEVEYINPLALCQHLEAHMDDSAVMVVDGGDFVATASYVVRPRTPLSWLDPGVFGTLGVGGGFAMAAGLCRPGSEVWLIYGDGSAAYSIAEFDSYARQGIPVIAIIGTNGTWQQILRDQQVILEDDVACILARSDYHKVAQGYGAKGLLLSKTEDIPKVLKRAKKLASQGHPVVINAMITDTDFRKGSISM